MLYQHVKPGDCGFTRGQSSKKRLYVRDFSEIPYCQYRFQRASRADRRLENEYRN